MIVDALRTLPKISVTNVKSTKDPRKDWDCTDIVGICENTEKVAGDFYLH